MLNCPTCGYESPDGAKYCRNCGAGLSAGSDPLEAATRNYGRQGPAVAAAGSAPLPPSIGDAVAGDTARYPQPFSALPPAYAPPGRVPSAADTSSLGKRKKRRFLKWGAFLLALLISGGIGAAINDESNDGRVELSREDRVRLERLRAEDQIQQTLTGSVTEMQERLHEELERQLESIERAKEDMERAAERGEVALADGKALDLTAYEYQGASAGEFSRIPGRELLKQRTGDDFETVTRFYQEKLGKPFVRLGERDNKRAVFQAANTSPVTVLVRESGERPRRTEIIILRSPFRFPVAQPDPVVQPDQAKPELAKPGQAKP